MLLLFILERVSNEVIRFFYHCGYYCTLSKAVLVVLPMLERNARSQDTAELGKRKLSVFVNWKWR